MAMQPNRGMQTGGSAAAKRLAEEKASRMGKRTDRNKLTGMGMTKTGVEQRALNAFNENLVDNLTGQVWVGASSRSPHHIGWIGTGDKGYGYKKPESQIDKEGLEKANNVRRRYGMKPKSLESQQYDAMWSKGYSPKYRTWSEYGDPRIGKN